MEPRTEGVELRNHELPQDACNELRRCGQGNALFNKELVAYKRLFEEDEEMDDSYKRLFVSLLSNEANRPEDKARSSDEYRQFAGGETGKAMDERVEVQKKRKGKDLLVRDDVRENAGQENNHPEYELFLKYLKEYEEKSCVLKSKNDSSYVHNKREDDISSGKDCEPERKSSRTTKENLAPEVERHPGNDKKAGSGEDITVGKPNDIAENGAMKKRARRSEDGKKISPRDSMNAVTEKTRDEDENCVLRKRVSSKFRNVSMKRKSRSPELRNSIMEVSADEDERVLSRKRSARGSRKSIIETSTDNDEEFQNVVRKKQSLCEDARVVTKKQSSHDCRNVIKRDDDEGEVEKCFSCKSRSNKEVIKKFPPGEFIKIKRLFKNWRNYEASGSKLRNVKASNKNINGSDDDTDDDDVDDYDDDDDVDDYDYDDDDESEDSDMDMTKSAPCHKEPFAPSVKFRDVGENSRVTPTDSRVEFRRRVLEVISKPYDKIEYMIIKKEFDSKYYTDDHPELGDELMKCRHNWRKRLALMRGFYFWIQNLRQEGAFKPWRDDICLAVDPQPLTPGNYFGN